MAGNDADGDDGIRYPQTINDKLIELGQLPGGVNDMGDVAALLFSRSGAAPIDQDGAAAGATAPAIAIGPSDTASLVSSTTGKHRFPV
jgi:hypothetical protein